ncbi:MAG: S8 family serine peptidase [Oscillospiraceae bacterium]|nr:S8 family serine peptidase [Oscillospiraceae bacterium]
MKTKKCLSLLLAVLMLLAFVPASAAGAPSRPRETEALSPERMEALECIRASRDTRGLVGFEGRYELRRDGKPVTIIVLFEQDPAGVQVIEAQVEGRALSKRAAERTVDDEHQLFRAELDALFARSRTAGVARDVGYIINWEYRQALNGVSVTLPSNMVASLPDFDSVRVVFPNERVRLNPPRNVAPLSSLPYGMADGRRTMHADELHAMGYRGAGVLVAVMDTGIDYNHPAFAGAFPTLAQMRARNPAVAAADTINGIFYGRNFVFDENSSTNNPMETSPMTHPGLEMDWTDHGTHVAGTIAGRDTGGSPAILGVAPAAQVIAYRVLGPGGWGDWDDIFAAIEQSVYDRPDVVNMSLGASYNSAVSFSSVAINNLMLAHPHITYVISAGNDGWNSADYSLGVPGTSSMAISVGAAAISGDDVWLADWSSRGPVRESFEIKPDIVAHGEWVFSAVPAWHPRGGEGTLYEYMSGTSMSAPHIAGAVALMVEYSRANAGGAWNSQTLKARIMNTASPMTEGPWGEENSVFDVGAGYINVLAAVQADTVVSAFYEAVPLKPEVPLAEQTFGTMRTGSLSFGGSFVLPGEEEPALSSMQVEVRNMRNTPRAYSITYAFTNNPDNAANLTFSRQALSMGANAAATFDVEIELPANAPAGNYEGHIYINTSGAVVARLPFAYVLQTATPPWYCCGYLPIGAVGHWYNGWLHFGSAMPIDVSIVSGALPPGLEIGFWHDAVWSDVDVFFDGIPTQTGVFAFTLRVESAAGYVDRELTIEIRQPEPPRILETALPFGSIGWWYRAELPAENIGGWWVDAWVVSGNLPPGIWMEAWGNTLEFWGMPTQNGTFNFTVRLQNAVGWRDVALSIVIRQPRNITGDFTDPNFLAAVRNNLGLWGNEPVLDIAAASARGLDVFEWDISSLNGLQHFTDLRWLDAGWNNLTGMDVSRNARLEGLWVDGNFMLSPASVTGWWHNPNLVLDETLLFFDQRISAPHPLWVYDHNPNSWARPYLYEAYDIGIISGRVLRNNQWQEGIARIYIADMAARFIEYESGMSIGDFVASRDPSTLYDIPFTDSNDPDVLALARLGVIRGEESVNWEGIRFNPYGLIDRQSAAVLLGRLITLFGGEVPANGVISQADLPFQDTIASWARGSVYFLYHQSPRIMSNTSSVPGQYLFSPQMRFQTQMMVIAMVRTINIL